MPAHEMTSLTCTSCQHAYVETALFCPNCGTPKARDAGRDGRDALIGKLLGDRFQVLDIIGQGGSGTIYRAEHITLRRKVAIKILHDELSRDDLAVERFRREATTVAEIDNEHIVEIHDFGRTPDGRLYLAMEMLEGETLDTVLARDKQLSVERAADILIQVGEALMEAHAIGYVHRDLRPRNIYLANRRGKTNFVKLLDFGLAKLVDTDSSAASTSVGMTFGDPRYMSPEQARGDRIDRRADIYQLGCVCYEMLTGAPPFTGNRVFDILTKQVSEAPAPLPTRRPGVPLWMEAAAAKMLAKDPDNRFATTTRMVDALKRGLETGEVMEDEVARRRESVPPPSVSRVMQKMGLTPETGVPPFKPAATTKGIAPVAEPARPTPPPPTKPDSVELIRKRTNTPNLGLSGSAAAAVQASSDYASSASGTIDPERPKTQARVKSPTPSPGLARPPTPPPVNYPDLAPPARAKKPTQDPGISQSWYDEGDDLDEAPRRKRAATDEVAKRKPVTSYDEDDVAPRKRKAQSSASSTDSLYDDVPRGRSKLAIAMAIGVVAIIGGVAFALTRGGDDKPSNLPEPTAPVAIATPDAGASTIIPETTDAVVDVVDDAQVAVKPGKPTTGGTTVRTNPGTGPIDPGAFVLGNGPTPMNPGTGGGSATTVVIIPGNGSGTVGPTPTPNTGSGSGSGVSGGPQDPYGGGGDDPKPAGSAEDFAREGQQQLSGGDATAAAVSFKKALELDPNNATATIGMGDIASRQGAYGAAIAHLSKAAKLAPKNAYVFTLLGEAYLRSGNVKDAAANFKKALQLDPNNARARDGYNEASAKVPPPTDGEE